MYNGSHHMHGILTGWKAPGAHNTRVRHLDTIECMIRGTIYPNWTKSILYPANLAFMISSVMSVLILLALEETLGKRGPA